jgi:lipoyl(octanoyl) transferase
VIYTSSSICRVVVVYHDSVFRSAAMNMAIDEALLESATEPTVRFYRWNSPALSFGYFGRFADIAQYSRERHLVRRWTGGGIVFHGEDLTYALVLPATADAFAQSTASIYEQVHRAVCHALLAGGVATQLSTVASVFDCRIRAVRERRFNHCFAQPVQFDVVVGGHKIAGAAQRRTRRGLLQQGTIQNVALSDDFAERFAGELADVIEQSDLDAHLLGRAGDIAEQKYATRVWLERR